ncbi:hypothetical protein ACF0H5_008372 [Mactra antiquata]
MVLSMRWYRTSITEVMNEDGLINEVVPYKYYRSHEQGWSYQMRWYRTSITEVMNEDGLINEVVPYKYYRSHEQGWFY